MDDEPVITQLSTSQGKSPRKGFFQRLFGPKTPLYLAIGIDKPRDDELGIIALDIWSRSTDRATLIRMVADNNELTIIEKLYVMSVFDEWLFE